MQLLIAVLFGGAACIGLDYLHATHGATRYFRADLFGVQPWWVLLLFPCAVLMTVVMVEPMRKLLRGEPPASRPSLAMVIADFVFAIGAYAITSFINDRPIVLSLLLVGVWVARCLGRVPTWVIVYSAATGLTGMLAEALLVALHQFEYQRPDVIGVAMWLPGIYLHAGMLGVTLSAYTARAPKSVVAAS